MISYIDTFEIQTNTWERISLPESDNAKVVQSGRGFYYALIKKGTTKEFNKKDRGFFNPSNNPLIIPQGFDFYINTVTDKIRLSVGEAIV